MTDVFRKGLDRLVSPLPPRPRRTRTAASVGLQNRPQLRTQRQTNIKRRLLIRSAAFGVNVALIQKKKRGGGAVAQKKPSSSPFFFFSYYLLHLPLTAGALRLAAPSFHHRQLCQNWPDGTRRKIWNASWTGEGVWLDPCMSLLSLPVSVTPSSPVTAPK